MQSLMRELARIVANAQTEAPILWKQYLANTGTSAEWARVDELANAKLTLTVLGEKTTALLCPHCGEMLKLRRKEFQIVCPCALVQLRRRGER